MDSKDYKYNKENLTMEMPKNILCKTCKNRLPDIGKIEGFNKISCKVFKDKKPMDVLFGRTNKCKGYSE